MVDYIYTIPQLIALFCFLWFLKLWSRVWKWFSYFWKLFYESMKNLFYLSIILIFALIQLGQYLYLQLKIKMGHRDVKMGHRDESNTRIIRDPNYVAKVSNI